MEALERYAAAVGDERRWVTGSAVDVGPDALDLSDAARCSASELAAPGFPLAGLGPGVGRCAGCAAGRSWTGATCGCPP